MQIESSKLYNYFENIQSWDEFKLQPAELLELLRKANLSESAGVFLDNRFNTKLHESELMLAIESLPFLVYYKNKQLEFVAANNAFRSWINMLDVEGKVDSEIYPSYLERQISTHEKEVLKSGQAIFNIEEHILIDGTDLFLSTNVVPYFGLEGEVKGVLTISNDISHHKRCEIELEKYKNLALQAQKAKEEFLANVSHELRTPLHAIIGTADMLEQQQIDEEFKLCVQTISQSGQSLLSQLDHILNYSSRAQMLVSCDDLDLSDLMDGLVNKYRNFIEKKGLDFRSFIDDRIPQIVEGDTEKLKNILEAILSNSIKFTDKGFIHLIVKETKREDSKIFIRFDIIDTGIGIKKSKLSNIYEAFSLGDGSSKKKHKGNGLGLAMAKEYLDLFGADYGFISEEHKGSHFKFEMPFKMKNIAVTKEKSHPSEISILLVEDNLVNQKIAYFSLKKMGFSVDIAENGEEAFQKYKKKSYQLILMDIQMPIMDGFEATEKIRIYENNHLNGNKAIIIALSANVISSDIQRCFEVGMNEFISKPFSSEKLTEKISSYFRFQKNESYSTGK